MSDLTPDQQATRNELAVITLAEAIVKAEWERIPAPIRALTEHRLTGDLCRGLER